MSPLIVDILLLMEPLAEKIRSHPAIQGISSQGVQHTITLFADDAILSLTDPLHSLLVVHDVFDQFNKVSYYKINASKSQIFGLGVDDDTKSILEAKFPFKWASQHPTIFGYQVNLPNS